MYQRRLLLLPAVLCGIYSASAQDVTEAFNLSNLTVQGTARSMGFGNALGSVGADFSTLSVNPAGIGIYRSSELTFTPSLRINGASSQYLGSTTQDNNTHFNINNFGVVFNNSKKGRRARKCDWRSVSFAFGMNRTADFNRTYTYSGVNRNSSATQAFESDANAYDVTTVNSLGYLGFQGYLIDPVDSTSYKSVVPFSGGINQLKSRSERGKVDEYVISFGGNYREKLMLGATLGLTSIYYQNNSNYSESTITGNTASNPANFTYFSYNNNLKISGGGINLKLGAIYKISDAVRVGAAFHTPTIYSVHNELTPYLESLVGNQPTILSVGNGALQQNVFNNGIVAPFDYSFTTPIRAVASATYIIKGRGFITADYEFVPYGSMRFIYPIDDGYGNNFQQVEHLMNQAIHDTYKSASNFRIGAEGLITNTFMARLGFGYYGSAYKNSDNNSQRLDFSAGLGYHGQHFFTDIAAVLRVYKQQEQPYSVDYSYVQSGPSVIIPTAHTDFHSVNAAWTIGVKF